MPAPKSRKARMLSQNPRRMRAQHAGLRRRGRADARQARRRDFPPATATSIEPKWDGFRAIVFRDGDDVYIQSRDLKPLDRYFPELHEALLKRCRTAAWSTARS